MDDKKYFKNPERQNSEKGAKYVPQYQILGMEPEKMNTGKLPPNTIIAHTPPRTRRETIHHSEAQTYDPSGQIDFPKNTALPNIGNNQDLAWNKGGDEIIDDLHPMIDNNEFLSDQALEGIKITENVPQPRGMDIVPILGDLQDGEYLLLLNGEALCSAPLAEIEKEVQSLVFGQHQLCQDNEITIEQIIVLKKVEIKVGVFLHG